MCAAHIQSSPATVPRWNLIFIIYRRNFGRVVLDEWKIGNFQRFNTILTVGSRYLCHLNSFSSPLSDLTCSFSFMPPNAQHSNVILPGKLLSVQPSPLEMIRGKSDDEENGTQIEFCQIAVAEHNFSFMHMCANEWAQLFSLQGKNIFFGSTKMRKRK